MKEELQIALAELIQNTLQGAEAAKDFLTAEIPDIVIQLLTWHGVYSFGLFMIGIVSLIISLYFANRVIKNKDEIKWNILNFEGQHAKGILQIIASIILLAIGLTNLNLIWLQIWIAPKVWLIEYIRGLIK